MKWLFVLIICAFICDHIICEMELSDIEIYLDMLDDVDDADIPPKFMPYMLARRMMTTMSPTTTKKCKCYNM